MAEYKERNKHYKVKSINKKILNIDDLNDFKLLLKSINQKLQYNSNLDSIVFKQKNIKFQIPVQPKEDPNAKYIFTGTPKASYLIEKFLLCQFDNKLNFLNNILWGFLFASPKFTKHIIFLSKALDDIRQSKYKIGNNSYVNATIDLEITKEEEIELLNKYYKTKYKAKSFLDIRNKILLRYGIDLFDYEKILSENFIFYNYKKLEDNKNVFKQFVTVNRKFHNNGDDWFYKRNDNSIITKYLSNIHYNKKNLGIESSIYNINIEYPLHQLLKKSVYVELNPFVPFDEIAPKIEEVYKNLVKDTYKTPFKIIMESIDLNKKEISKDSALIKKYKMFEYNLKKSSQKRKFKNALLLYIVMQNFDIKMTVATRYLNYYILKFNLSNEKICVLEDGSKILLKDALELEEITIDTNIFISEEGTYQKEMKSIIHIFKKILHL